MSNSNLVTYTKLSPNMNAPRNQPISKITIHHMAGNYSLEQLGESFSKSRREASANYGIDSNGNVGLYVDEANRSWASASPWNDNRAVTIEVANDEIGGGWHVSDVAFNKLIDLCVDICQRNNFRLSFDGTQNGSLTMHKMFAATACPGPYLEGRFPEIVDLVNARLDGGQAEPAPQTPTQTVEVNAYYRVRTQAHGWLPEVENLKDFAGFEGSPITDVAIRVDRGSIKYRVHVLGEGWRPYVTGYNINDYKNGFAGEGKVIDAIEIYFFTPGDIRPYKRAKYMVNAYSWQYDNEKGQGQDGYAGVLGVPITELRLCIEEEVAMSINLDIILYICGVITSTSAAVAIVIKLINKKITKTIENNKMFKNVNAALVSQIRYQIDTALRRAKAEGHVSNYSMSALESLFEVYKAMGGNGFVESEMEEIRKINQNGGK